MLVSIFAKNQQTVVQSIFIFLLLQIFNRSTLATDCQTEMKSSPYCVCSLASVIDNIVALLKESHREKFEEKLETYKCKKYIQLPQELTKSSEYPVNLATSNYYPKNDFQNKLESMTNEDHETEPQESFQDYQYKYTYDTQGGIKSGPRKDRKRRDSPDEPISIQSEIKQRIKRQIVFGVPKESDFSDAVAKMPSSRANHQYIPLGSPATIQCFNPQEYHQYAKWKNKKIAWIYYDGRQVTTSQMAIDQQSGSLTIFAVQLLDTDVYNCTVELLDNQNKPVEIEIFSHQIDVISEPKFWLQMSIIYTTSSLVCVPEEMLGIEKSISPWLHAYVCENCEVRNVSVMCNTYSGNAEVLIQLTVTTFGIESKIPTLKYGVSYSYPLSCSEKVHTKILHIVDESLVKLFQLPILMTDAYGEEGWYDPIEKTRNIVLEKGCLSGFYWAYKLCFPCDFGQYSSNGKAECSPCPIGTYQDRQGSAACVPCLEELTTVNTGSESKYACIIPSMLSSGFKYLQMNWIIAIIGFVVISITLKILSVVWYFPRSKFSIFIKFVMCCCGCCQSSNPTRKRVKKRESNNSLLLTTEGYTTDDSQSPLIDRAPKTQVINELKSFENKLRPLSRKKHSSRLDNPLKDTDRLKSLKDRVLQKSQNQSKSYENRHVTPKTNKVANYPSISEIGIERLKDRDKTELVSSRNRRSIEDFTSEGENPLDRISNPKRNQNTIKKLLYGNSARNDNFKEDEETIYQNEPSIMDRNRNIYI